ncbi:MAG: 1-acyl-sn-glycerol-3-phosphate acyltransferase [Chlamydiae bacterium]|nr:MAG: 1-acyl-sn-glycerol-3-phosphate acyltransferase [Chlamydiota bacterium]
MKDLNELVSRVLCWGSRTIAGVTARWIDCEPSTRQRIYFANHSSHLDILILWSSLPVEIRKVTRPVAAGDYWLKSKVRRFLVNKIFNAIVVQRPTKGGHLRDAVKAINDTLSGMGENYSLIIFPEGTRGDGYEMANFKGGIYSLAKAKPGIEFVPVFLENLNRILPKGELLPVPLISSISFGKPFKLEEDENKKDFLKRARQSIINLQNI